MTLFVQKSAAYLMKFFFFVMWVWRHHPVVVRYRFVNYRGRMNDYLTTVPQAILLGQLSGYLLAVIAIGCYFLSNSRHRKWLLVPFVGGICWSAGALTSINDFLHEWDEQFHALVAKNMIQNPLKPMLFGSDVKDPVQWGSGHIWLHKQPLFLWQIALSLKVFGTSVLAVRIPSILFHGLTALLLFQLARRVVNERVAFLVALLFGFSAYHLCVVGGMAAIDHNDVAFTFYVTASLWALMRYYETGRRRYMILIGAFSGCAVLTKWLVGLLVYLVWFVCTLVLKRWSDFKKLALAFIITVVIFLPWQCYCYYHYTELFLHEMTYNGLHFLSAVEDHSGDYWFHWQAMRDLYGSGDLPRVLILLGLLLFFIEGFKKRNVTKMMLGTAFLTVYLFFSFARTKMPGFTLIVSPIGFLLMVYPVVWTVNQFRLRVAWWNQNTRWIKIVGLVLMLVVPVIHYQYKSVLDKSKINLAGFHEYRTQWTEYALKQIKEGGMGRVYLIQSGSYYNVPELAFISGATIYAQENYNGADAVIYINEADLP